MTDGRPSLRVVSGSPTPEELAVVTAILAAAAASGPGEAPRPRTDRGGWSDPAHRLRQPLLPGPNAWRAHFLH